MRGTKFKGWVESPRDVKKEKRFEGIRLVDLSHDPSVSAAEKSRTDRVDNMSTSIPGFTVLRIMQYKSE